MLEGRLRYCVLDPASEAIASETILEPGRPGLVLPDRPHRVEPLGARRMKVEFYAGAPWRRRSAIPSAVPAHRFCPCDVLLRLAAMSPRVRSDLLLKRYGFGGLSLVSNENDSWSLSV